MLANLDCQLDQTEWNLWKVSLMNPFRRHLCLLAVSVGAVPKAVVGTIGRFKAWADYWEIVEILKMGNGWRKWSLRYAFLAGFLPSWLRFWPLWRGQVCSAMHSCALRLCLATNLQKPMYRAEIWQPWEHNQSARAKSQRAYSRALPSLHRVAWVWSLLLFSCADLILHFPSTVLLRNTPPPINLIFITINLS